MSSRKRLTEATNGPSVDELRARLNVLEARLAVARIAFVNGTPLDGDTVSYDKLSAIAKEYIQASYALQKSKFGSIKVRLSVAKLLR